MKGSLEQACDFFRPDFDPFLLHCRLSSAGYQGDTFSVRMPVCDCVIFFQKVEIIFPFDGVK
jgi:hypothetical protein